MADVALVPVPREYLSSWWPLVADQIRRVADRTPEWTLEGMVGRLERGEWLLWLVWDGSSVLGVGASHIWLADDGSKILDIPFMTGRDMVRWHRLFERLEEYARGEGVSRMRLTARKGWARILKGFDVTHVLMEKGLIG